LADHTTLIGYETDETYASDDIDGVKHQRVKISIGEDGEASDLSLSNPLPVGSQSSEEILNNILLELKRFNNYMALMTNEPDPPSAMDEII